MCTFIFVYTSLNSQNAQQQQSNDNISQSSYRSNTRQDNTFKSNVSSTTPSGIIGWILYYILGPSKPGARWRVVAQGIFGGLVIFGIFTSLNFIPATNATAIFFSTPIFAFVFASFMLKEPYKLFIIVISVMIVVGVLLVTRANVIFDLISSTENQPT